MLGKRCTVKNYRLVSLLSLASKVLEKFVNNRLVYHLQKCGLLSDFQCGFRSSRSTADLLTVVSDRTALVFNRYGATRAVALDIHKAFNRVWHTGSDIWPCLVVVSNTQLQMVLDGKSSQEYPVNAGVP